MTWDGEAILGVDTEDILGYSTRLDRLGLGTVCWLLSLLEEPSKLVLQRDKRKALVKMNAMAD